MTVAGTFKVIACDLDGTLLDADHRVGRFSAEIIRAVVALGVKFVIATGRHLRELADIRAQIGAESGLITCNGARVYHASGEVAYHQDLPAALVRELARPALARGSMINLYTDDEWLISGAAPNRDQSGILSSLRHLVLDPQAAGGEGVAKLFYRGAPSVLREIERDLETCFGSRINVAFSVEDCLEVTAPAVDKGRALATMLGLEGLSPADCLAFGDGMNDVPMLQVAGKALVMGNASPRVKAALPDLEIIGGHDEEAMAHYLRRLYQL